MTRRASGSRSCLRWLPSSVRRRGGKPAKSDDTRRIDIETGTRAKRFATTCCPSSSGADDPVVERVERASARRRAGGRPAARGRHGWAGPRRRSGGFRYPSRTPCAAIGSNIEIWVASQHGRAGRLGTNFLAGDCRNGAGRRSRTRRSRTWSASSTTTCTRRSRPPSACRRPATARTPASAAVQPVGRRQQDRRARRQRPRRQLLRPEQPDGLLVHRRASSRRSSTTSSIAT